jgi:hypothetical protein
VQAAHDLQIVHRDLKPGNVLFDGAGEPMVADFGLAKRGTGSDLTQSNAVMGTPAYMAPEQAGGRAKYAGPPADVWGLGVVLYGALTGRRPFPGQTAEAVLVGVLRDDPRPPRRVAPGVPLDLELVCLKCLAKDPADRYTTAADLADDLDRVVAHRPIAARPPADQDVWVKWGLRQPHLAAAVYALVLLGGVTATSAALAPAAFARFLRAAWAGNAFAILLLAVAGISTAALGVGQVVRSVREGAGWRLAVLRPLWLLPAAACGVPLIAAGVALARGLLGGEFDSIVRAFLDVPFSGQARAVLVVGLLLFALVPTATWIAWRRGDTTWAMYRPLLTWFGVAYGFFMLVALAGWAITWFLIR